MNGLVFGVGVGTFIVLFLWVTSLVLCFVSLRTRSNIGPVFIVISVFVMTILFLIPRGSDSETPTIKKVYDPVFIWRNLLASLLGLTAVGSLVFFFTDHVMEEQYTKLLRRH